MDIDAVNLTIWKHMADEIRWAYSESPLGIALIVAAPGAPPIVAPMSNLLVEEYQKRVEIYESNGGIGVALEKCLVRHREIGKTVPAIYFIVLQEDGEWAVDVMKIMLMSRGGMC